MEKRLSFDTTAAPVSLNPKESNKQGEAWIASYENLSQSNKTAYLVN
jgi:hypothetical protein